MKVGKMLYYNFFICLVEQSLYILKGNPRQTIDYIIPRSSQPACGPTEDQRMIAIEAKSDRFRIIIVPSALAASLTSSMFLLSPGFLYGSFCVSRWFHICGIRRAIYISKHCPTAGRHRIQLNHKSPYGDISIKFLYDPDWFTDDSTFVGRHDPAWIYICAYMALSWAKKETKKPVIGFRMFFLSNDRQMKPGFLPRPEPGMRNIAPQWQIQPRPK